VFPSWQNRSEIVAPTVDSEANIVNIAGPPIFAPIKLFVKALSLAFPSSGTINPKQRCCTDLDRGRPVLPGPVFA
jgi:hypothetical protein